MFFAWSYISQILDSDFSAGNAATDLTPEFSKALSGDAKYVPGTDNQFVRLSNGDLIAVRMSYIGGSAPPYWNGTSGARVGMLTMRSRDCGETWEFNGFLDPAKIVLKFDGKDQLGVGAYPQQILESGVKKVIQGGGDREEFYADPWDAQTVYTTLLFAGNYDRISNGQINKTRPLVANTMVFGSADGGKTWGRTPIKMFDNGAIPIAMTATRARRLFLFNCVGSTPTLHLVKDGKYVQSWPVFHGNPTSPENACAGAVMPPEIGKLTNPGSLSWIKTDVSISRVNGSGNRDTVRVVYPAVRDGRRIAHVVVVRIQESAELDVDRLGNPRKAGPLFVLSKLHEETIVAADETGSIIYPTFIEIDRVDLPKSSTTNTAVLYWYETACEINVQKKTASVRLFTRYSVFRDDGAIVPGGTASKPRDLSVTNRFRRSWSPLDGEFIGDYMRGAFAYDGKLRFIAQWPERSPDQTLRIHYNVVTVEP